MIVYHGTTAEIRQPKVAFSKNYLDFGRGFYLTIYKEQAEKWAMRKSARLGKDAVVNVYELSDNLSNYRFLSFNNEDEKWLDYICACRRGDTIYKNWDIVSGRVADDDVFKTVDMYFRGLWDKEKTISELRYYKQNNQICIINQQVIENCIKFIKSYKVGE